MAKRICIIGRQGSGKSTFAIKLAKKTGLPLVHLDQLWWNENWVQSTKEEFDLKLDEALEKEEWIMDGNFSRTLKKRCEKAEILYAYDLPRIESLYGYIKRAILNWGKSRVDMPKNCVEKIDLEFMKFIWDYKLDDLKSLKKEFPHLEIVVMKSHEEAERILKSIK